MAITHVGEPFKGKAYYWVEATYGGGETAVTLPISCKIQNIRIDTGDRHKVLKDIGSPLACKLLEQTKEPTVHLEYIPQCDDTLIDDVIDRTTCCTLQSLAMEVGANTCLDTDDQSWYYIIGMKPSTVRISASKNTEYLVVIDFEAKSVTTSTASTGTEPTALTGSYLAFNIAGEITKSGGWLVNTNHIAFITDAIDITVSHQLTGYTDHDSTTKDYLIEGNMDIEGTVDITLDGGGAQHIGEVFANTDFTLTINLGGSGCPQLVLTACQWKNSSVNIDVSGEAMMTSAPFTCKPTSCTNIVLATP